MPTEAEFLDAIDANPDDDAPRLAHADWLEQSGQQARAEFIRLQVAGRWADPAPWVAGLPTVNGMSWSCRRGYPEAVRFKSQTAFKKGWPLTAGQRVRHVVFDCVRGGANIAAEPALASIPSLDFTEMDANAILAVLRSSHIVSLRYLSVRALPSSPGFLVALAALPALTGLRSLEINNESPDPLEEAPVAALACSPHLAGLRVLRLKAWLDEGAMRALFRPASLTGLTSLEIGPTGTYSSGSRQAGLDDLGDGSAMPGLEWFAFTQDHRSGPRHEGGDAGLAVARAPCWARLRGLDLSGANVADEGATALAGAGHLWRLERLGLSHCKISDAGATALASSTGLGSLTRLDLEHNLIGRSGTMAFGRSEGLPALRALTLRYNPAPEALIQAVEARFRDGGPPLVEEAPKPLPAVPAPSAPLVGHADEDGLVRAIWTEPWDEAARLVYADWLDEQGKPTHAAILRAPPGERGKFVGRLAEQMAEGAPGKFQASLTDEGLVRVKIALRVLNSAAFERDGPAWMRKHHVAELVPDGKSGWEIVFAAGWLEHTRGLSFDGRPFDAWEALAGSPRLAALSSLDVVGGYVQVADKFFGGSGLSGLLGLCRLRVGDYLQPDGVRALCEAPFAQHLRYLSLGGLSDVVRGLPVLTNAPGLCGLVSLDLARKNLSDGDMRMLADATGLASLRNLDVSGGHFGDLGADALAGSALLSRLSRLRISARHSSGRHITAPALGRLARALPPRCRLVLAGEAEPAQRGALADVLGERLLVE